MFQLPYWKDGDIKMTESKAIMRHIARVYDQTETLLPKDPKIAYKVDMLENIIHEAMMKIAMFAYNYDVCVGANEKEVCSQC